MTSKYLFLFSVAYVYAVPGIVYREAQLILLCSNYFQDVKSELRLKIVPLNVTAFRDAGTVGLPNGVISPNSILTPISQVFVLTDSNVQA